VGCFRSRAEASTGTPERTYSNLQQVLVRYPAEASKFPRSAAIFARVLHNILLRSKPRRFAGPRWMQRANVALLEVSVSYFGNEKAFRERKTSRGVQRDVDCCLRIIQSAQSVAMIRSPSLLSLANATSSATDRYCSLKSLDVIDILRYRLSVRSPPLSGDENADLDEYDSHEDHQALIARILGENIAMYAYAIAGNELSIHSRVRYARVMDSRSTWNERVQESETNRVSRARFLASRSLPLFDSSCTDKSRPLPEFSIRRTYQAWRLIGETFLENPRCHLVAIN